MRNITHIVIHTAAAAHNGVPVDQDVEIIRDYHKNTKGWSDIGYHAVIRFDGLVQEGRPQATPGAGVKNFNATTYHICCTGHGDLADFTPKQKESLVLFVLKKLGEFGIIDKFVENPSRVLGHRECYLQPGVPDTGKSCPGKLVNMRKIRKTILALALEMDDDFNDLED